MICLYTLTGYKVLFCALLAMEVRCHTEESQTETITIRQIRGRLLSQQHVCRRNPHMKTPHWLQVFISIMC